MNWNLEMLVFVERERLECSPGETLQRAREKTNNKPQPTYDVVSKRTTFETTTKISIVIEGLK